LLSWYGEPLSTLVVNAVEEGIKDNSSVSPAYDCGEFVFVGLRCNCGSSSIVPQSIFDWEFFRLEFLPLPGSMLSPPYSLGELSVMYTFCHSQSHFLSCLHFSSLQVYSGFLADGFREYTRTAILFDRMSRADLVDVFEGPPSPHSLPP
jgi:hypothetical protein